MGTPKAQKKANNDAENKECPHEYCHRNEIVSDKAIGLPWASGLLHKLPGQTSETSILSESNGEKDNKQRFKKLKNDCKCYQKPVESDCLLKSYPKYIDVNNDQLVEEELNFFLNILVTGNIHHTNELELMKNANAKAKQERNECLKKKKGEKSGNEKDENEQASKEDAQPTETAKKEEETEEHGEEEEDDEE